MARSESLNRCKPYVHSEGNLSFRINLGTGVRHATSLVAWEPLVRPLLRIESWRALWQSDEPHLISNTRSKIQVRSEIGNLTITQLPPSFLMVTRLEPVSFPPCSTAARKVLTPASSCPISPFSCLSPHRS